MEISLLDQTTVNLVVFIMVWLIFPYIFMLIKLNFYMTNYHQKVKECLFFWYIAEALSGRPWIEIRHLLNPEKGSVWDMMKKRDKNGLGLKIRTESEARIAAKKLFQHVAKPRSAFIELEDLALFLPENDALATFTILQGGTSEDEKTPISCSSLQHWMLYAFRLERSLVLSMKDTDFILSSMTIIAHLIVGISLAISSVPIVLKLGGYKLHMFYVSLALLAITVLPESSLAQQSIQYFFLVHPMDVGERCQIDGVELVVKKINLFSTVFIGLDNKEHRFSHSTLWHKGIRKYTGSSRLEKMQLILG